MHISAVLVGGLLGFFSGLVAYFGFDIGVLGSMMIWAASGPVTLLFLAILMALRPDPTKHSDASHAETA